MITENDSTLHKVRMHDAIRVIKHANFISGHYGNRLLAGISITILFPLGGMGWNSKLPIYTALDSSDHFTLQEPLLSPS